ncbi:hypothetical protein JVT61DRAFT_9133 [Boletus reticuloceps]|uniref:Uncharacterized protein n=1 Tax=Boletus reticuloceps TaxID=495285 RepID=A0A8I3A6A4_9AGAM|nr:hypothetical protein JVT61DRAFT_9456 [Boletus reticuloceps]KAG6371778.1 hypothetical protein JVT61DRAFT_9133 [Boletus reticuloceps]
MLLSELVSHFTESLAITDREASISPPLSQRPEPPSSPTPEEEYLMTPPPQGAAPPCTFDGFRSPFSTIPDIPNTFPGLAYAVQQCIRRMGIHCAACYFLRHPRPIKIVTRHRGGYIEKYDNHANETCRCPWRLIDHPDFNSFCYQASASLGRSNSGGGDWFVCSTCAELFSGRLHHQRCIYGEQIFMLAYLVWEHLPTRGYAFSFLSRNNVLVPNFQDRNAYAQWLGESVDEVRPTVNNIHLLVVAYHLLRWANQLPR